MSVSETLEFDASAAERTVDQLGSQLTDIAAQFQSGLEDALQVLSNVTVQEANADAVATAITDAETEAESTPVVVEADADAVTGEIDSAVGAADSTVGVDADVSPAEAALTGFESEADNANPTLEVDADTSNAEASLSALSSSADDAGGSLTGAQGAAAGFSAASDLATGSAAGLGSAIGDASDGAGLAVGAFTAGAGAVAVFFKEALDSDAVTRRFRQTLGGFADQVDNIHLGSLNTDISTLALRLGSSDEQMRRAATNAFLFATNSGIAQSSAAQFSTQILALGARAAALNPDLGDAGDAAQTLMRALITGRERALVPFNLGLNKTEVATRAAQLALAAGRTEVSGIDKAMAGAQLASEKFGGSLENDIARGAENPTIKLRALKTELKEALEALGKPLVAPIFDLLQKGLPFAEAAAKFIAQLATGAVPLLTAALTAVTPILQTLTDLLDELGPTATTSALAMLLMSRSGISATGAFGPLPIILAGLLPLLTAISPEVGSAAIGIGGMALAGAKLGSVIPGLGTGIGAAAGATIGLGQAVGGTAGNIISMAGAGAALGTIIPGVGTAVGAAAGAVIGLGISLADGGESVEDYRKRIGKLADELKGLGQGKATHEFIAALGETDRAILNNVKTFDAAGNVIPATQTKVRALADEFRSLASGSPVVARTVLQGLLDTGKITADQFDKLSAVIDKTAASHAKQAAAAAAATLADQALASAQVQTNLVTQEQQVAFDTASAAAQAYKAALDVLINAQLGQFGSQTAAAKASQDLATAYTAAKGSIDLTTEAGLKNRDALATAVTSAEAYGASIRAAGGDVNAANQPIRDLANQILFLGSASGQSPHDIAVLLAQVGLIPSTTAFGITSMDQLNAAIASLGPGAAAATAGVQAGLAPLPGVVGPPIVSATNVLTSGRESFGAAGHVAGSAFPEGVGAETSKTPALVGQHVAESAAAGTRGTGLMADAGRALGAGFANGLSETRPAAAAAGGSLAAAGAGGTRGTGAFAEAGAADGQAFADALRNKSDEAFAAGQAVARAGKRGVDSGGSPSIHLFHDSGVSFGTALTAGMLETAGDVTQAGRELARAGVQFAAPAEVASSITRIRDGASAAEAAGGITIAEVNIVLPDGVTPETAGPIGEAAAEGFVSGLEDRRIIVAARTGARTS